MNEKTIFVIKNPIYEEGNIATCLQGYFQCPHQAKYLKEKYKILAEPIGSFCHLTQQKQMKGPPFLLDAFSLTYLIQNCDQEFSFECQDSYFVKDIIKEDSYIVFQTLTQKGYYLISAKKFGANFLAYDNDPATHHAKYLVFLSDAKNSLSQEIPINSTESIVLINRLSTIAKKEAILAKLIPISYMQDLNGEKNHTQQDFSKLVQFSKMQRLQHY
ncbi:tRNA intron endonuclease, catalytic carboxy-terminal domain protein (macronuclear) [Tetrahymena thermophila SB210]|uniref:tRNA-intron lyase n=1 Tax=Tetrahymena thermophila (strain SB210) TaxID=312017 RepID=Q23R85_TETTS|nr:tRNA intron endonuclease, catalytic carboxy-terminal domain protein [Tetrahymena thermophila SB210]EAR99163.2 tRNA intron endonuclease, catalytic carboxy-terminal domain protein [Tetrahymena thermophila SB210]|eukprot:XP_001019408.2 tRNA intron endonuclease, catalytic carboxy-terminal domain protein [Tetrahymena thermophila SB210]